MNKIRQIKFNIYNYRFEINILFHYKYQLKNIKILAFHIFIQCFLTMAPPVVYNPTAVLKVS